MSLHKVPLVIALSLTVCFPLPSQTPKQSHPAAPTAKSTRVDPPNAASDDGEKVFSANCERCHAAPQGFSPRIAGTVVRHMRARANLSEKDVQTLLRFFNP